MSSKRERPTVKKVRVDEDEIRSRKIEPYIEPDEGEEPELPEEESAIAAERKKNNRSIMAITYVFLALFVGMIIHLVYFVGWESDQVINSSYNRRETVLAERVVRGKIISSDGVVLAETLTDDDGDEYRYYPYKNMFAHSVGRVNRGKTGLESSTNLKMLYSHDNGLRNAWSELKGNKLAGDNVITTLNFELQKVAYDALGDRDGVVIAIEPDTGKILCMVSKPDYNPNTIEQNWEDLIAEDAEESALLNRATQGLYPPGSTFKVLTTLAFMRQKTKFRDFTYTCAGTFSYMDVKIQCYNQTAHGTQSLKEAFANSCNSAFAKIGSELDWDEFYEMCETFFFNTTLPSNVAAAKSQFQLDGSGSKSLIPQTSIGQGDTLMTPMHNAMMAAMIANGGVLMKPYLVDRYESSSGSWKDKNSPELYNTMMSPDEVKVLTECMRAVVSDGSAAKGFATAKYRAAGKTGSAEYNAEKESHAWFIGFAPYDDPEIAICVLVEGGGSGGTAAVPIARKVFDAWLDK